MRKILFIFRFFGFTKDALFFFLIIFVRKSNHILKLKVFDTKTFKIGSKIKNLYFRLADITTFFEVFYDKVYKVEIMEPKTIVDLGSHIGLTTLYFQSIWPEATFYCVEPSPKNFKILEMNVNSANLFPIAIAAKNGVLNFDENGLGSNNKLSENGNIQVKGKTFDLFCVDNNLKKIDVLKIDIEGAEDFLLQSINSWKHIVSFIIIEPHNGNADRIHSILSDSEINFKILN